MGLGPLSTERLYFTDPYLTEFTARVTGCSGDSFYLDRTAFYPESGGQPHDLGTINGVPVVRIEEDDRGIAHILAEPVHSAEVRGIVDWARRFDHMQQHTGQHLLSAVLVDLYHAQTVGFHMSADYSTIDVSASALGSAQIAAAEERANALVFENRPVTVSFEEPSADLGLRKPSEREGVLRIITIEGYDRSACGGTHVRSTGEIGPILIRKVDRAHSATRIEFLCGGRAVRRARADFEALSRIARTLSAPLDETPALVAAQTEAFAATEKNARKLAVELARLRGRDLYTAAAPNPAGLRRHELRIAKGALDDEVRALAQGFTANPKAVFVAVVEDPPAIMLAVSPDAGIHAGNVVKAAVTANGGRGGGSANAAQGSVPSREALAAVLAALP